ncbi:hypothetical protein BJX70DRAFT_123605 [Aspergillus crustosus]
MQVFLRISARLVAYYETAMASPEVVMPTDNDLFLVLEHQLLSVCYDNQQEETTDSNLVPGAGAGAGLESGSESLSLPEHKQEPELKLDEPLRQTLLSYLNLRIWHLQSFPFMQYMVTSLKATLLTTPMFCVYFLGGDRARLMWDGIPIDRSIAPKPQVRAAGTVVQVR